MFTSILILRRIKIEWDRLKEESNTLTCYEDPCSTLNELANNDLASISWSLKTWNANNMIGVDFMLC